MPFKNERLVSGYAYLPYVLTYLTYAPLINLRDALKETTRLWLCLLTYLTYFTYLTYAPLVTSLDALGETRDSSLVVLTYLPYLFTLPYLRAFNQPSGLH
jgi:hypothetical protein